MRTLAPVCSKGGSGPSFFPSYMYCITSRKFGDGRVRHGRPRERHTPSPGCRVRVRQTASSTCHCLHHHLNLDKSNVAPPCSGRTCVAFCRVGTPRRTYSYYLYFCTVCSYKSVSLPGDSRDPFSVSFLRWYKNKVYFRGSDCFVQSSSTTSPRSTLWRSSNTRRAWPTCSTTKSSPSWCVSCATYNIS